MFSNVLAWFRHILHLDHHGVLPPAPTAGEAVSLPAAPPVVAPVPAPPAPEPAPAPVNATYPVDGIATYADANHCIRIKYFDDLRAEHPRIAQRFMIEDMVDNPEKFNLSADGAKVVQANTNSAMMNNTFAGMGNPEAPFYPAANYSSDGAGGTMVRRTELDDAMAIAGDNWSDIAKTHQTFVGIRLADLPAKIELWKAKGELPVIDHQPGVVAS